jgi:hypothetical protein
MKQFEMECTLIKIASVSGVSEFKGEDFDHGCSVRFERMFENTILDEFDPDLRTALYKADDGKLKTAEDGQGEFAMPLEGIKLTARKCQSVQGPIKFSKILTGWEVIYHYGANEASAIKAKDVKFTEFTLVEACDGGSVLLSFKAYQKLPPEVQGFVDHMAKTSVECTFRAPVDTQVDFVDESKKKGRGKKKTAAEKAGEDPFAGTDIPPLAEGEQASRDGTAWPFPSPGAAHGDGTETPVDEEVEQTE